MRVRISYYAWVREAVGCDDEWVDLPADVTDVAALVEWLAARGAGYAAAFARTDRIRAAIGDDFVGFDARLNEGSDVALFPPVTGG